MYALASLRCSASVLLFGVAGAGLLLCKGRDVRPGVPPVFLWRPLGSAPLCFYLAWQARDLLLCKGRDVRPGVPPVFLWRPLGSAPLCFYLAWQARDLLLCKGRDVRLGVPPVFLWRPFGSAPLCFYLAWQARFYLAWQARQLVFCKGRDVRPGVPPRLCASIWRGRCGSWCSARGVQYIRTAPFKNKECPLPLPLFTKSLVFILCCGLSGDETI